MCDQDHYDDDLAKYLERSNLSRRDLGALSLGVGLALLLPRAADALDVKESDVDDQDAGRHGRRVLRPPGGGRARGRGGLAGRPRPTARVPRDGQAARGIRLLGARREPVLPVETRAGRARRRELRRQKVRDAVLPLAQALNATTHTTDAKAFVAWLDTQPAVDKSKKIGTTGYCMGGPITMRTAAAVPERVGAGASFHGGGLATNAPDSPHLLVPKIKAQYLFAVADNDDMRDPDAKNLLRDAFAKTGVPAEIEVYKGAMHGWCALDATVYDKDKAERAWSRLLALFEKALA